MEHLRARLGGVRSLRCGRRAPRRWTRRVPTALRRTSEYLTHPVFHAHRSETAMLRYLRSLADKDYALDRGMIPLGSCTMKLNATTEMEPVTWPEFANMHPFAPADQTAGYAELVRQPRGLAGRGHRVRRGERAAQRRLPGRARRPARHPGVPPGQRRRRPRRLPHPVQRARHERGQRRHGRHAGRRGRLRQRRQRRPGRPRPAHRGAPRPPRRHHGDLPVDPRRVRDRHRPALRQGARRRRSGLCGRCQPQRAARASPSRAGSAPTCRT